MLIYNSIRCIKFPSLLFSRYDLSVFVLRGRRWRNVCQGGPRNEMTSCGVVIFTRIIIKRVVTRISRSRMREYRGDTLSRRREEEAERFQADVYYYRLVDNTFPSSHPTEKKVCKIAEYYIQPMDIPTWNRDKSINNVILDRKISGIYEWVIKCDQR